MAKISQSYVPLILLVLFVLATIAGCGSRAPEHNEYMTALAQVKEEHLRDCQGLPAMPEAKVYGLHQDYNILATVAAQCRTRHNTFAEYLRPLVAKAKSEASGRARDSPPASTN